MKSNRYLVVALGLSAAFSYAQVIKDTNVLVAPTTFQNASFSITVQQQATGNSTTVWFSLSPNTPQGQTRITPITWNVDEEADFYLTQYGDMFSAEEISKGKFPALFTADHPRSITIDTGSDFYLGIATGLGFKPTGGPNRDTFGWVHLQSSSTGISAIGSAMAYGLSGITVGTISAVPELNAGTQMLIGLAAIACTMGMKRRYERVL